MSKYETFEEMPVWIETRKTINKVYNVTGKKKVFKDFDLARQMRRAIVSVLSNISEGFERRNFEKRGDTEFIRYLSMAKGSAGELRAQLYVALDQGYMDKRVFKDIQEQSKLISKMLSGLIKYLKK